jgi:hypothetical protein
VILCGSNWRFAKSQGKNSFCAIPFWVNLIYHHLSAIYHHLSAIYHPSIISLRKEIAGVIFALGFGESPVVATQTKEAITALCGVLQFQQVMHRFEADQLAVH